MDMKNITAKGNPMTTKSDLSIGSTVRLHDEAVDMINAKRVQLAERLTPSAGIHPTRLIRYDEEVIVTDLMSRKSFDRPDDIGIKQAHNNLASRVALVDIAEVIAK